MTTKDSINVVVTVETYNVNVFGDE